MIHGGIWQLKSTEEAEGKKKDEGAAGRKLCREDVILSGCCVTFVLEKRKILRRLSKCNVLPANLIIRLSGHSSMETNS